MPLSRQKTFLVIGASKGIGKEISHRLATQGHQVLGVSRTIHMAPMFARVWQMDIAEQGSLENLFEQIENAEIKIHGLIFCVGYSYTAKVEHIELKELLRQFDVNFFSAVRAIQGYIAHCKRHSIRGTITALSSLAGELGLPFQSPYCASKFALEGFCESIQYETVAEGIQVHLFQPGDVATGFCDTRIVAPQTYDDPVARRCLAQYQEGEKAGSPTELVAAKAVKVALRKTQKLRIKVGKAHEILATFLKKILPQRAFQALIARTFL